MARAESLPGTDEQTRRARRSLAITGGMLGVGIMGAVDTILFHQILQWHNFYVDTTPYWRIVSDGLLHWTTATLLFLGALRLWDDRRLLGVAGEGRFFAAMLLLGAGGFQLFDGVVNHLILQLHPVREGVAPHWPYDVAWNAAAVLIILIGLAVLRGVPVRGAQRTPRQARVRQPSPGR